MGEYVHELAGYCIGRYIGRFTASELGHCVGWLIDEWTDTIAQETFLLSNYSYAILHPFPRHLVYRNLRLHLHSYSLSFHVQF